MIRILIVEDEPPIARAIAKLINQHPSFEVIGTEIDGSKALERIAGGGVDAVFTDIRMPVMDGIALLRHIHENHPDIMTVVISGYQEFDYAKAAIGYQAMDYLLKPLSREKVSQILERIEDEYHKRTREEFQRQVQKSIAGEDVAGDNAAGCMAAVVCAGAATQSDSDFISPGQAFWSSFDFESALEDIFKDASCVLFFDGKFKAEKVIVLGLRKPVDAGVLFADAYDLILSMSKVPITMIGHGVPVSITEVGKIITGLNRALFHEAKLYKSEIIWRDISKARPKTAKTQPDTVLFEKVIESILAQNESDLRLIAGEALRHAEKEGYSSRRFLAFWEKVLYDGRIESEMDMGAFSNATLEIVEAMSNATDYDSLCSYLIPILLVLGDSKAEGKKAMKEVVEEIEQFLTSNYNKSISNDMLANKFGFVPSYISKIFRKYKNVSPSEYLTRYRIDKAKQLMDTHPDALVRDIANLTGYSDPYYFSKIFKKETGVWPSEYQKK